MSEIKSIGFKDLIADNHALDLSHVKDEEDPYRYLFERGYFLKDTHNILSIKPDAARYFFAQNPTRGNRFLF